MERKDEVLKFITAVRDSFHGSVEVYTKGSCFKFFEILKLVFPDAKAFYDSSHIITKIGEYYYDITGEVAIGSHLDLEANYSPETSVKDCRFSIHQHVIYCEDCDCAWKIL